MFRTVFTLLMIFGFITIGHSQITKVDREKPIAEYEVKPMGTFWASLSKYENHSTLTFKDAKYQHIDKFVNCRLTNETVDQLYELLISKDAKEGDEYHVKTLDESTVYVVFDKMMGVVYPQLYLYEGEYDEKASLMPQMNKKQLKKLFGKN